MRNCLYMAGALLLQDGRPSCKKVVGAKAEFLCSLNLTTTNQAGATICGEGLSIPLQDYGVSCHVRVSLLGVLRG